MWDVARRREWEDAVLVSATLAAERLSRAECCWDAPAETSPHSPPPRPQESVCTQATLDFLD